MLPTKRLISIAAMLICLLITTALILLSTDEIQAGVKGMQQDFEDQIFLPATMGNGQASEATPTTTPVQTAAPTATMMPSPTPAITLSPTPPPDAPPRIISGVMAFEKQVVGTGVRKAHMAVGGDLDGDGDMDWFTAQKNVDTIAWFENDGAQSFTYHEVYTAALHVRTVLAVDLNLDGLMDALSASVKDDTVAYFENDGEENFSRRVIDGELDGAYSLFTVDMDFDGDLDILGAARDAHEVVLYWQYRAHEAVINVGDTLLIDRERLRTVDDNSGPEEIVYTLTGAPTQGEVCLNDIPLSDGHGFTQADVNNDGLAYVHSGGDRASDHFTFVVAGADANEVEPAAGSFTIEVR